MAKIAPYPYYQLLDDNGDPLAGGKVSTFESGTVVNKTTFTTQDESTPNANPVILDANGRADIWLGDGAYTFVVKTSADVTIKTVDDITGEAANVFGATVTTVTTNRAVAAGDENAVLDCTSAVTLSLLAAATAEEGFLFSVRNSSSGNVIIDPNAAELVDGAATKTIGPEASFIIVCTGTAWITICENYGTTNTNNNTFTGNNSFSGDSTFTGDISVPDEGELTIASGVITATAVNHTVDTQSDAASDDLDTITAGSDGQLLLIRAENTARTVVVKDGTGNIETPDGKDITLDTTEKVVLLEFDLALAKWLIISSPSSVTGTILQTKETIDTTDRSTTSTSFVTTTGVTATFDSSVASGSKVVIDVHFASGASTSLTSSYQIFRDTGGGDAAITNALAATRMNNNSYTDNMTLRFEDTSPGTGTTKYTLYFKTSTGTTHLGRIGSSSIPGAAAAPSVITITEIAG